MKAFFGTALGKVLIGVVVAAVVAGGGFAVYKAVQADPAPAAEITDPTEEVTTTEALITTEAETTTEEEVTEAPTEAPTEALTAAPTAPVTDKPTTTTKATTTSTTTAKPAASEAPEILPLFGGDMRAIRQGAPGAYYYAGDFGFTLTPGLISVPEGTRWEGDDGTVLKAGQDMAGQRSGKFIWVG